MRLFSSKEELFRKELLALRNRYDFDLLERYWATEGSAELDKYIEVGPFNYIPSEQEIKEESLETLSSYLNLSNPDTSKALQLYLNI